MRPVEGPPALLLLDEVLIYVENAKAVPLGDTTLARQVMVFLQRLTEVVRGLGRAAMVYSLQASVHEAARDESLLADLDHLVTRIDAKREPVAGDDVMRVVQRRLFQQLGDPDTQRAVAAEYAALARRLREATTGSAGEPTGAAQETEQLEQRILASYPFHPDLLDLMYHRWGSLPSYQRTRGALQFLACVVHALWRARESLQPLIGPGDVPLADEAVRNALFSQVGERERYHAVLDADITGPRPRAALVDERVGHDSPALRPLRVGTRLATAAFLYSFGARSGEDRGVVETELVAAALAPGLDRTVLVAALSDLREQLLYLHYTGRRYRFEPQPNLNKLIADEALKYGAEEISREIEKRLREELGTTRGVALWPREPGQIPDREPVFTLAYLPLEWAERSEVEVEAHVRHLLDHRTGGKREFRNALGFAVPARQPAEVARTAVRAVLAIEELKRQRKRHNFSPEQLEELDERRRRAEDDLTGALRKLYEVVKIPVAAETGPEALRLETVDLRAQLASRRTIHERLLDGLRRWVHGDVRPHKLVALTRLGQPEGREFVSCAELVGWFFGILDFPKLLDEGALRIGIAEGIGAGQFGYVPAARLDGQGGLVVDAPALIRFGLPKPPPEEIDLSPEAYLLAPALVARLRPPAPGPGPAVAPPTPGPEPVVTTGTPGGGPGTGTAPGRRYALAPTASKAQVFRVFPVLQNLSDRATAMRVEIRV